MRPQQKNNRQRGRGRGGKPGGNITNRVFESAGPEGKVRGTPQQIIEKYLALARDAQTSGDRVVSENFLQHAEHYSRMLIASQVTQQNERRENGEDSQQSYGSSDGDEDEGSADQAAAREPAREAAKAASGMDMIEPSDGDDNALVQTPENSDLLRTGGGTPPAAASGAADTGGDAGAERPKRRRRTKPAATAGEPADDAPSAPSQATPVSGD